MRSEEEQKEDIKILVQGLAERFGREPTEEEVMEFIMGDQSTRDRIWNSQTSHGL